MSYRFTNTEKWQDCWFSELSQIEMLLFIYLCDNCDIAGFIEINFKRWSSDLGSSKETIQGALKGLTRGLIYSNISDCIYIKNFLKHQKNLPLNSNNQAHKGIIKRFNLYSEKFDIKDINEFIEGASKGLSSPIGIGNGIGNGNGIELEGEKIKNWREDYNVYLKELRDEYSKIIKDNKWILERKKYHPKLDILLSLEKSCVEFWSKEDGWIHKKKNKKTEIINWRTTFIKALDIQSNKVYEQPISNTEVKNNIKSPSAKMLE